MNLPPITHHQSLPSFLLHPSPPRPTPHHIILVNHFFPNLFLTNRTHKSQIGFAHCCASLTFSPENSPGGKLIPETGNHHTWGFQLENKSVGMKEARRSPMEKNPTLLPGYATVSREAQDRPGCVMCEGRRVPVLRVCLIKGWLMFPGAGVSFYFWAVISPLKVQNSSARFESTHSLLFLVCEWPEIVSIVIDLNFHFDDGTNIFLALP